MSKSPAERLREARLSAGYATAADAARAFGWKLPGYRHHENGTAGFSRLADVYGSAFGVSPEWLLFGRGSPTRGDIQDDEFERFEDSILGDDDRPAVKGVFDPIEKALNLVLLPYVQSGKLDELPLFRQATNSDEVRRRLIEASFDAKLTFSLLVGLLPIRIYDQLKALDRIRQLDDPRALSHPSVIADVDFILSQNIDAASEVVASAQSRRILFYAACAKLLGDVLTPNVANAAFRALRRRDAR